MLYYLKTMSKIYFYPINTCCRATNLLYTFGYFPYICFVLVTVFVAQKFVVDAFVKVNYTIAKLYKSEVDIDKVCFQN